MEHDNIGRSVTRQWRILITEGEGEGLMQVDLSWRTFPAKATHWDGHKYTQFVHAGDRVSSADDLRRVLVAAVEGDWWSSLRARSAAPRT